MSLYILHLICSVSFNIPYFTHDLLCAVTSRTEEEMIASCVLYAAALPDLRQLK